MLIQERLQLILKMHNISPAVFADKLGVQRSNVSHVLSGRNKPGLDFLEKILVQFPRVNAHWLITGEMPLTNTLEPEQKSEVSLLASEKNIDTTRTVITSENVLKIVEFYADGTFKEFYPKNL